MRRLQGITSYLLRHRWQALALTFFGTFVPVIGVIGILIAAFMTLLKGVVEGLIFTLAATLPYVISFYYAGTQQTTLPLVAGAAVGVAVLSNVLTWIFAVMLRRRVSWSGIIQVAALLGVLAISVVHLAVPDVAEWWGSQLQAYYNQAQTAASALKSAAVVVSGSSSDVQTESISTAKYYATGLMTAAILLNAIFQLVVARWWQAIVFSPGSLRRELHHVRLSYLAGFLFACSLVLSYLGNEVVLDIMPVLYLLFGAAGLSLIHYFFGQMRTPLVWFWLMIIYAVLIFSLPISVIFVAMLALLDSGLDLRKRFKKV